MSEYPHCTFRNECMFRYPNGNCKILNGMPKERKSGVCPFSKKHLRDIGGKEAECNIQQK